MPDYIYLLESRLSADQQNALRLLREAALEAETILFLVGDAVRDLTSGHAVREMEVALHGNALKLKKKLEKQGAKIWGEDELTRSLYLCFPGTVRVDLVSTHRTEYPRLGKAVVHPASIHEDLRRRDFTVNAMAISLNEGSFGLLMDPLNGAADIEGRTLRLVSNYGFLEDPSLLIRAVRYRARLGWEMDPRTGSRYENAKNEGVIEYLSTQARSREVEQIGHEEEGLKVLRALEAEGWMKYLYPAWTSASADEEKLNALHELAVELLMQGVHADTSAAQMRLLTAKMPPKDLTGLKKLMLRPGFVEEWSTLDAQAASFAKELLAKQNATPSISFKLFTSYDPEAVLWLGFASKDAAVKERFDLFLKEWPEARQRIPHALMQELRITPELPGYAGLVQQIFLELIDGRLTTPEEIRAFLEPHSPPAPPPPPTIKRSRARRGEARIKEETFEEEDEEEEDLGDEEDLEGVGDSEDEEELDLEPEEEGDGAEDEDVEAADMEEEPAPATVKKAKPSTGKAGKHVVRPAPAVVAAEKPVTGGAKTTQSHAAKTAEPAPKAPATKAESGAAKPKAKAGGKIVLKPVAAKVGKAAAHPKEKAKAPAKAPGKAARPVPKPIHKAVAKFASKPAHAKGAAAKTIPVKVKPAAAAAKKGKPTPAAKSAKSKPHKPAAKSAKKR
jgi:tRNA nucleotidyltransferase (CCA-adding enzyme)